MQVREIMQQGVRVVSPSAPVTEAAMLMRDHSTSALPVWDGEDVVGLITERDIVVRAVAESEDLSTFTVDDVMTGDIVTCSGDDDVDDVRDLMSEHHVHRIPVLGNAGQVIGLVSLADLAFDLSYEDQMVLDEILQPTYREPHSRSFNQHH